MHTVRNEKYIFPDLNAYTGPDEVLERGEKAMKLLVCAYTCDPRLKPWGLGARGSFGAGRRVDSSADRASEPGEAPCEIRETRPTSEFKNITKKAPLALPDRSYVQAPPPPPRLEHRNRAKSSQHAEMSFGAGYMERTVNVDEHRQECQCCNKT